MLIGGWPAGCNNVITGPSNVGKDLILNKTMAALQEEYGEDAGIAVIYTEGQWDKSFGRLCGMHVAYSDDEIEEMEVSRGKKFTASEKRKLSREVGILHFPVSESAESALEIAIKLSDTGAYQIIIINSVDGLVPNAELEGFDEGGMDGVKRGRGGQGRGLLLSNFFRQQQAHMQTPIEVEGKIGKKKVKSKVWKETAFFWVSQLRTKQIGRYSTDNHMSGGQALRYYAATILRLDRSTGDGDTYYSDKKMTRNSDSGAETSNLILTHIVKGKYGIADGERGSFRYYKRDHTEGGVTIRAGTIDDIPGLRAAACSLGVIQKKGKSKSINLLPLPDGTFHEINGRIRLDSFLRENPDVLAHLEDLMERTSDYSEEEKEEGDSTGEENG
jgi:RecA/RadA recombinase